MCGTSIADEDEVSRGYRSWTLHPVAGVRWLLGHVSRLPKWSPASRSLLFIALRALQNDARPFC